MARSSSKKTPARPAPRRVDGIVFSVAMETGDVEVIGIPFEHRGRTWAVHAIVGLPIDNAPFYTVSDVLTGRHVPNSEAPTLDAARSTAIATLDAVADASWAEAFGAATQPTTA
ncbi:hypothetical protein [Burkholderia vietnamiensis]|uniref:hypothetical protein n=1 Tax=Burkholderia vietnamiensis TaxID=60552 RepID=UPI001B90F8C7|nr:hypothetical protein [Burkholderia vietnamiensis]MBR8282511.1 hypothetical protein [Burkholderia vietnamiensis]